MKLSIIVPVYQAEATIDRCLKSVVGQSFRDFEVIVIDDGSPDRCPYLCDEWGQRDDRIRVIHQENGGLSEARNTGIDAARGEFITFVDADDFLADDTYELLMPVAEENDMVEYPICWQYGGKKQRTQTFGNRVFDDMMAYWIDTHAYEHCYVCNKIFRRNLFDGIRFPKGQVFEDVAALPLLLEKASKVCTCEKGLYYYCANPEGITAKARGKELTMLLDSHLTVLSHTCDERYYMHVLNIQMDVCEMTGAAPRLPFASISPFCRGLTPTQRMKASLLNLLGIKGICKVNQFIHKTVGRRS